MNTDVRVLQVPIEDIIPNRFQPRLAFDDASLKELAESIKQHGIIQPLVLRRLGEKYEIIAGERRYKAATMAGLASVPAIITTMDDRTSAEVAIVENVQRKDLTAIEEARSYKALLDKGYMTQEDLAKKMGLSQSAISNKLRLLSLDESVQEAVIKEEISERHARSLLKIKDAAEQKKMLSRIINERLTVRRLEEEIKKMNIEEQDVPLVNSTPDINSIMANATDINPIQPPKTPFELGMTNQPAMPASEITQQPELQPKPINPSNIFSNPEQMPNKFFNFLEDEAANMSIEESQTNFTQFNLDSATPVNQIDAPVQPESDIEMLDFGPTDTQTQKIVVEQSIQKNDLVEEVINKIRALNLNSDRVSVEEINFPTEYYINIKIKKDPQ